MFSDYETIGYSLKLIEKELAGIKMIIQIAKAAEENISGHFQKFNLAFINKKEAKTRPMDVLKFIIYGRADIEPKDKVFHFFYSLLSIYSHFDITLNVILYHIYIYIRMNYLKTLMRHIRIPKLK